MTPNRDILANEKNFLGCLLRSPPTFWQINDGITPEMFTLSYHRDVYSAIRDLSEGGRQVTTSALQAHLPEEYDEIGPTIGLLATLKENAMEAGSAIDYADALSDFHVRRQIVSLGEFVTKASRDNGKPTADILESIEGYFLEMVQSRETSGIKLLHFAAEQALAQTALNYQAKDKVKIGLETGIVELDQMIGPLMGGDLVTLAAPSGHGKTALVTQILCAAAQKSLDPTQGKPAFFVSQEMQAAQIARRVMASWTRISTRKQRAGSIDISQFEALQDAARATASIRILFDESGRQKASSIARKARSLKRMHDIGSMAVDHLLLIKPENPKWTQIQTIENAAMVFKDLAKELDIVIFQLAQLTRDAQKSLTWRFSDQGLYGGDMIKQASDIMLALTIPTKWLRQRKPHEFGTKESDLWLKQYNEWEGKAEIGTLKVRDGDDGDWSSVQFDGETMQFGSRS